MESSTQLKISAKYEVKYEKGLKKDQNPMKDITQVLILDYLMELSVRPPCNALFLFTSLPILTLVSCVIFLA